MRLDHEGAYGRDSRDRHDQNPLLDLREHVLERDRGRVDVGERLVRLVQGDGEQGECGREPGGRDGRRDLDGVADTARQDDEDAEREHPGSTRKCPTPEPQNAERRSREKRV